MRDVSGYESIGNDIKNFIPNTVNTTGGAVGTTLNIFETIYNTTKDFSIKSGIETWKANQDNLVSANKISNNKETSDTMNNLKDGKYQDDIEKALNYGFAKYDENGNVINNINLYNDKNDKVYGTHNDKTGESYINAAYNDMTDTYQTIRTASHENAHNYTKNDDIAHGSEKYGIFGYWVGNVANGNSINKNGIINQTSWNNIYGNSSQINYNTSVVRSIAREDRSNLDIDQVFGDSRINSRYSSAREHPIDGVVRAHNGTDVIPAENNSNTIIHSLADGVSLGTYYQYNEERGTGWGNYVYAEYTDNDGNVYRVRYAHMPRDVNIPMGTPLREGQELGPMGATGGATGPHAHIEVEKQNPDGSFTRVDPESVTFGNYRRLSDIPRN